MGKPCYLSKRKQFDQSVEQFGGRLAAEISSKTFTRALLVSSTSFLAKRTSITKKMGISRGSFIPIHQTHAIDRIMTLPLIVANFTNFTVVHQFRPDKSRVSPSTTFPENIAQNKDAKSVVRIMHQKTPCRRREIFGMSQLAKRRPR